MTNPCKGMIRTSVVKTHDSLEFAAWHMTKRHERIKRKKDWNTTTKRMMGWGWKWRRSEKKREDERRRRGKKKRKKERSNNKNVVFLPMTTQEEEDRTTKKRWKRSAKCSFEDAVSTKKTRLRSSFKVKCLCLCLFSVSVFALRIIMMKGENMKSLFFFDFFFYCHKRRGQRVMSQDGLSFLWLPFCCLVVLL